MFGKKKSSNFDKMQSVAEVNTVRNRDVHAEQQMERSEIGEKKSMTSRIILTTIVAVFIAIVMWIFLSVLEMGLESASESSAFDVFFNKSNVSYQTDLQIDEQGACFGYIPATIIPGSASPKKLSNGVSSGDSGIPTASQFWALVDSKGSLEGIQYGDYVNLFFRASDDASSSYVGRYNEKGYTKLNVWDIYEAILEQQHWAAYASLFDPSIESVSDWKLADPSENRPARVDASVQDPAVMPPVDIPGDTPGDISGANPGVPGDVTVTPGEPGGAENPGGIVTPGEPVMPVVPSNPENSGNSGEQVTGKNYFLSFKLWKIFWTLLVSGGFWGIMYLFMKKNLDAQNQLEDVSVLNQYTNDQHIQFPEESMRMYDWFPDVGAHSDVCVSSMLSHVMLSKKGLKNVDMAKRADKDIIGADGDVEYFEGEILLDADGQPIYESVPIIDEKFADALYDSASVVDSKERRLRYTTKDIPYNPASDDSPSGKFRDKLPNAETVADMINKYWSIPYYEPQRPAGAYLVDTAPTNTMV